jgi:filamentous hemagglutinin family protein
LNPGQTVIDWVPDDPTPGPIVVFQSGGTATFSSTDDFAVLNRINVADNNRQVFMNGTIRSTINGSTGGDVFFYSPSGFVIGANATIDVGSLVLTSRPITVDGNGNFINNGVVQFGAVADPFGNTLNPLAAINTVDGSQINALTAGSYVALVAPRVEHDGAIAVNGQAALVGAEAATINFRTDSLFDITVDVGTTDGNGVVVGSNGSIGGPASSGSGDLHRAYLVAVPKNSALTMLISSGADLGFDVAGAADVVGNAVVLSAGHNISFGDTVDAPASGADADISIQNASFSSAVYGRANGDLTASSVGGTLSFASDASLRARDLVKLEAGGDGNVTVGGNLTMSANASGENEGDSAQAGNVTLQAFAGGQLSVTGDTALTAVGSGGYNDTPGTPSGDGRAGTVQVQAKRFDDM